uniref:Uncharacterized protein n=1 Tax=Timema poppense TaxID=170557 RepID=A0A7R9CR28_TIMPO|nr:unnamed protein product [Timema poppensis]
MKKSLLFVSQLYRCVVHKLRQPLDPPLWQRRMVWPRPPFSRVICDYIKMSEVSDYDEVTLQNSEKEEINQDKTKNGDKKTAKKKKDLAKYILQLIDLKVDIEDLICELQFLEALSNKTSGSLGVNEEDDIHEVEYEDVCDEGRNKTKKKKQLIKKQMPADYINSRLKSQAIYNGGSTWFNSRLFSTERSVEMEATAPITCASAPLNVFTQPRYYNEALPVKKTKTDHGVWVVGIATIASWKQDESS